MPRPLSSVKKPDHSSSFPFLGNLQEPRIHNNDFYFIYGLIFEAGVFLAGLDITTYVD